MSSSLPVARAELYFSGHVQNVGFRYSVLQVAKGYEVTGFVENLNDGRVHLVAEGETGEVDEFLVAVGGHLDGYIRKTERADTRGARMHLGFVIR
jgi:acylphosphatase